MKKYFFAAALLLGALAISAQPYKHSVGVNVGSMNGLSYKGFIKNSENLAIVVDLNTTVSATQGYDWSLTFTNSEAQTYMPEETKSGKSKDKFVYWSFVANPNLVYQGNIVDGNTASLHWFAGAGLNFGFMQSMNYGNAITFGEAWSAMSDERQAYKQDKTSAIAQYKGRSPYSFKLGINAIAGLEVCLKNAPITLGIDFRPGWGEAMRPLSLGSITYEKEGEFKTQDNATGYSARAFFDWSAGLSIRYRF